MVQCCLLTDFRSVTLIETRDDKSVTPLPSSDWPMRDNAGFWLAATVQSVTGPGKMDVVFMAGLVTKIPLLLPLINYSPHVRQTESQHTLYIKLLGEDLVKDSDITIAFGKQYLSQNNTRYHSSYEWRNGWWSFCIDSLTLNKMFQQIKDFILKRI